jgi:RNA polymerase sigma-70 factor (ECF subfamily)
MCPTTTLHSHIGEPGSTSSDFLARVRGHETDAWRRLTQLYGPLVYSWARRNGLQPDDSADVVQETFRAVALKIGEYRHDRPGDTFRGWLWTIARSKLLDYCRRRTAEPRAVGGTAAQEMLHQLAEMPSESSAADVPSGNQILIRRALDLVKMEFEDRTWQAFWLVTIERNGAVDVANELGISAATVYQAKSRVLRKLRLVIGDLA